MPHSPDWHPTPADPTAAINVPEGCPGHGRAFTPGPWRVEQPNEQTPNKWIVAKDNPGVAKCEPCDYDDGLGHRFTDEDHANARLIAAAPELFEALEMARSEFYDSWHPTMSREEFESHPTIVQIDAAIAKATGAS